MALALSSLRLGCECFFGGINSVHNTPSGKKPTPKYPIHYAARFVASNLVTGFFRSQGSRPIQVSDDFQDLGVALLTTTELSGTAPKA